MYNKNVMKSDFAEICSFRIVFVKNTDLFSFYNPKNSIKSKNTINLLYNELKFLSRQSRFLKRKTAKSDRNEKKKFKQ